MAYEFNGTNQYLGIGSAPASGSPMTIAAWVYQTSNLSRAVCAVTRSPAQDRNQISITATGQVIAYAQGGSGFFSADTVATLTLNTYSHVCGVFSSSASRTAYLNGGNAITNTGNIGAQNTATDIQIGARIAANVVANYFNGKIAEVGIWNVALTQPEIASLAKGMTCDKIRPQNLVFYAPLVRDLIDTKGRAITNNNGATVANHPRIYP